MSRGRTHTPLRLQRRRLLTLLAAGLSPWALPALPARAQDAPAARLRWRLEGRSQGLEVGEVLMLSLEVWVSSWFQAPVEFPATLAAEGALVELVGGSPDSRFEELGGQRWTGLIRRYRLLPVQPGEVRVSLGEPLLVHPGGGQPRRLPPPAPLRLQVRVPAGAEDIQPFVAARRLELRQRWWPEDATAQDLQVGDLLRREIVLLTDSSSPLLPTPDFGPATGTRLHVQAASVQEQRAHAAANALLTLRHEGVYTLEQAGRIELPAVELVWWDLQARRRRVSRLEGRVLAVRAAQERADPFALPSAEPASVPEPSAGAKPLMPTLGLAALLAAAAAAALAWRRHRHGQDPAPIQGVPEPSRLWRRLRRACRLGLADEAETSLAAWLQGLPPAEAALWRQDAALAQALEQLERHRFAARPAETGPWRGQALWLALSDLRRAGERRARAAQAALPTLHP